VPTDSTLSPARADPHPDGDVVVLAPKDWSGAEEALSRLAHEAVGSASDQAGSDIFAGLQISEPSLNATLRPPEPKDDRFPRDRPSLGRRASRALARFVMAVFIGVAAILAWQSYGEAAKQRIARRFRGLAMGRGLKASGPRRLPRWPSRHAPSLQETPRPPRLSRCCPAAAVSRASM